MVKNASIQILMSPSVGQRELLILVQMLVKHVLRGKSVQTGHAPRRVWMDKSIAAVNASIQILTSLSAARLEPPRLATASASHVLRGKSAQTGHVPRRVWMDKSIAVVNASIQILMSPSAGQRELPRLAKTPV